MKVYAMVWDSKVIVWDFKAFVWDLNAKLWRSNANLCYDVCCKRDSWTDCIRMYTLRLATPLLGKVQTQKRIHTKEGDSCVIQDYCKHQEQTPDNVVHDGRWGDNLCQENPCPLERKMKLYISGRSLWLYYVRIVFTGYIKICNAYRCMDRQTYMINPEYP